MNWYNFLSSHKACALATGLSLLAPATQAQLVVVDAANGSPDNIVNFNNLQDAVASFRSSASTGGAGVNNGNIAPNVVNVVATTPVTGTATFDADSISGGPDHVVMDENLTINGVGGLAVFAGQYLSGSNLNSPSGTVHTPAFAWRQKYNLNINDMAIIPADSSASIIFYAKSLADPGSQPVITLNRCVITANDGANAPLTTTGQDDPETTAPGVIALPAGGDAMYLVSRVEQGNITCNMTDTIIASFGVSGNSDGIIMYMQGATSDFINCFLNMNEGCVIANSPRFGIQNPYGGFVNINGSPEQPVVIRRTGSDAIWNFSDASGATQPTACAVNNARFVHITGSAIKEQETANRGFISLVSNTRIAHCTAPGIAFFAAGPLPPGGQATATVNISDVVIHNTGTAGTPLNYDDYTAQIASPLYNSANASNRNIIVNNAVLSGESPSLTGMYNSSPGAYNVDNTLVSVTGVNALGAGLVVVPPGVIIQGPGNSFGAVTYTNTTNPFLPDFLVPVGSSVNDWSVY